MELSLPSPVPPKPKSPAAPLLCDTHNMQPGPKAQHTDVKIRRGMAKWGHGNVLGLMCALLAVEMNCVTKGKMYTNINQCNKARRDYFWGTYLSFFKGLLKSKYSKAYKTF